MEKMKAFDLIGLTIIDAKDDCKGRLCAIDLENGIKLYATCEGYGNIESWIDVTPEEGGDERKDSGGVD